MELSPDSPLARQRALKAEAERAAAQVWAAYATTFEIRPHDSGGVGLHGRDGELLVVFNDPEQMRWIADQFYRILGMTTRVIS